VSRVGLVVVVMIVFWWVQQFVQVLIVQRLMRMRMLILMLMLVLQQQLLVAEMAMMVKWQHLHLYNNSLILFQWNKVMKNSSQQWPPQHSKNFS